MCLDILKGKAGGRVRLVNLRRTVGFISREAQKVLTRIFHQKQVHLQLNSCFKRTHRIHFSANSGNATLRLCHAPLCPLIACSGFGLP